MENKYLFVFKNGGWWLKINSISKLLDYYEKTDSRWSDALSSLINSKEFCKGKYHASDLAYAIGFFGSNNGMDAIRAAISFREDIINSQMDALKKYGSIYINEKGGYHFEITEEKHDQFLYKDELIYPDFKKEEIRVKKFPGGTHFYAYIGNMEVRDGDIVKWNTYQEAYDVAAKLVDKRRK